MKAGFPGAGIGGVFYVLLVAFMPFDELRRTLQGRSSARRWRRVGRQTGLVAGILGALYAEWWGLAELHAWLINVWSTIHPEPVDAGAAASVQHPGFEYFFGPVIAAAPFVVIAVLCVGLQVVRLALRHEPQGLVRRSLVRLRS
jgi:hypothetical protein